MDPTWIMVGFILVGQLGGSVWVVATLRADVKAAHKEAAEAKEQAQRANKRIDHEQMGARYGKEATAAQ